MVDDRSPSTSKATPPQLGELERLGPAGRDVMVLGLDAPGFDDLSIRQKILAYYLYRAAVAGDAIMYQQNHRHALEVKNLLEGIHVHSADLRRDLRESVHDYLKYIWIHHGNYNHSSHTKFVPNTLTPAGLRDAAHLAAGRGARLTLPGEPLDEKLQRLERTIFDPEYESLQSNQLDGVDMIATSAVNFYDPSLTARDIEALPGHWQRKLNVRFSRDGGKAVPDTFKIGGLYGQELATASYFLEKAVPYAEADDQRRSIELLLDFYRSGEEEDFRRHSVYWLRSNTKIDYVHGFIEQYIDPRGIIGNFEGNVSFAADSALADRFAANATYFEERMPWPDRYKRTTVVPPVTKLVNVLVETGDAGPVSPAAYNLPNYNDIRRDHGSKNVMLVNVEKTRSKKLFERMVREFYLPEYHDIVVKYRLDVVRPLQVYMHEIIGHGSGQPDPSLTADPRTVLGRLYSPVEECRADLVALYHMSDPKLIEIGAYKEHEQQDIVMAAYLAHTQGWMTHYDRIVGYDVREAHNKGHQLILMYLVENGGDPEKDFGVDVIDRNGNVFVHLRDAGKVRQGIAQLLERLQVIKSTGDVDGAAALFDRFAARVRPEWHDNILSRLRHLNVPKLKAFVFPRLQPVIENGDVVDVTLHHDEDLTAQQLRFSRLRNSREIASE